MKNIVNIVKNALLENRRLSDNEMELIIEMILNYYKVVYNVNSIKIDYHSEYSHPAGYDFEKKMLYFNMNVINEQIFRDFYKDEKVYTFNEFFILHQLILIFHEIRHILQQSYYFDNNEVIKKIVMDCNLQRNFNHIYNEYYSLFPVEKDAVVFSLDETANLMEMCEYFSKDKMMPMYQIGFNNLIKGYDLKNPQEGLLRKFYEHVVGDKEEYERLQSLSSNLTTYDKMSFNFSINSKDLIKLILAQQAILDNQSPSVILKKEIRYK